MMQKKPEISDEVSASLKTYLDASRMYDWKGDLLFIYLLQMSILIFLSIKQSNHVIWLIKKKTLNHVWGIIY